VIFKPGKNILKRMKTLQLLQKNRKKIYQIAEKHGVSNIRVFGSVARGEETKKSDIDLLVKVNNYNKYCSGFGRIIFEEEMANFLHRKVDVITESSLHHLLKNEITATAKSL
jgi:predicted nucleotidyltransferase